MEITRRQQGAVGILALRGALNADGARLLKDKVDECIRGGALRLVIEVGQVPFIDSVGLEHLQDLVSQIGKRGGDVRVASPNDVCKDIFHATRMETFIQVYDESESAVRSLL